MLAITLIISSLNPGGAERVLSGLANYWVAEGYLVTFITFAAVNDPPFYPLDSRITLIQLGQENRASSLLAQKWRLIKRLYALRKTIKSGRPDVIISFIDLMNLVVLMVTRRLRIPVVISERIDPAHHDISRLGKWLRLKLYPLAACLVVQTKQAGRYFPDSLSRLIKIVPNAVVMPENFRNGAFKNIRNIISVGRLDHQKGHDTLIRAFSMVVKCYPHLILTIYGEGPERKNIEDLIRVLGLEGRVYLPGTIKKIQEPLRNSDLFVFPSRYEGFPNALCEAMAMGLPVIVSNCSGNTDVVRDGIDGKIFPVDDVQTLIAIMIELLENPVLCEKIARHAKEICNRFHPNRIFKLWDDILVEAKGK